MVLICFVLPIVTNELNIGRDILWLVYLLPAIILSYYFGLKGGIITALIGLVIQLSYETMEYILTPRGNFHFEDYIVVGTISSGILITAIGIGLLADRLKRKQHELEAALMKMENMAFHDELSNLPNRRMFIDKLTEVIRDKPSHQLTAILFADLDRFKVINDTLGHLSGDLVIAEVARQLARCIGAEGMVARMGGDEFTVLLDKTSLHDAKVTADKIIECFKRPLLFGEREIYINLSIGIALYPQDGLGFETLMQHADAAMYMAKESGGNTYHFFSPELNTTIVRKLAIEAQLRLALKREEFTLNYQPQVVAKTRQIVGLEALIRWKNAELDLISPTEFVPVAEEMGLIIPIGEWVLTTACRDAKSWHDKGFSWIRMSVNISPIQLIHDQFEGMVNHILEQTGFDPKYLEFEITENVALYGLDKIANRLQRLRESGIQISIDDFGTGYSSLSYLINLPLDSIKIDRFFIRNVNSHPKLMTIAAAIIGISKAMNYRTVAEGVETAEELKGLELLECDIIQGYIFSKPVPFEGIEKMLEYGLSGQAAESTNSGSGQGFVT